jgi:hypothetical protein
MRRHDIHENLSRDDLVARGSERSFGLIIAVALGCLGLLNWLHSGNAWPWLWSAAALFAIAGLLFPAVLAPFNRAWTRLGLLIHVIVEPVVLGAVLPIGLLMRAKHRDPLRLEIERDRTSYWIKREPPGPQPHTMKNQF